MGGGIGELREEAERVCGAWECPTGRGVGDLREEAERVCGAWVPTGSIVFTILLFLLPRIFFFSVAVSVC